ncbi:MAG: hypothetical protein AAF997_19790 [Myxococcota bacterium]
MELILLGTLWLAGCTVLNDPDRSRLPNTGGSAGAGGIGGAGGADGIELFCDDGTDDDEDTLIDCEDSDCDEEPACCERRSPTITDDWQGDLRLRWTLAPTEEGEWTPATPTFDGNRFVGDFGSPDTPRSLISGDCVSLALGGWVTSRLRSVDAMGCTQDEPCDRYTGFVLTAANDSAPGIKLPDELAVTLHAGGLLLITQADVELARATATLDEDVTFEIALRPALDEDAQPILRASVTVDGEAVLEDFTMTGIADLIAEGECGQTAGLNLAVQSQGTGVFAGPLEAARQDCANPSQFQKQVATLTGSSLRFASSWRSAYIGAPALASSRDFLGDVQWDLIVEGSNDAPELEPVTHVGYAIGHARDISNEGDDWSLDDWVTSNGPKAGDNPPSCITLPGGCDDNVSVREPHLLAEQNEDGVLRDLVLSFAREVNPVTPDIFGVQVVKPIGAPLTPVPIPESPTLSPEDVPECEGLRDPALIPVDPDALNGYWLLFSCFDGPGAPSEIHAVRLTRALEVMMESGAPMRRVVLTTETLGSFAQGGIRAPEPLVVFSPDGLRIRVWFLAQESPGTWSVALAEGRTHDVASLETDLPEILPFPVNPILRHDSPLVLSDCLGEECSITGIAVSPRGDDSEVLRFVLARRVNLPGGVRTDQLVPLEQLWRMP